MSELRTGVVGTGSMGRHHARVYADQRDVDLIGVSDADGERAQSVARRHGTDALALETLLERIDVVSIAVPTEYHYQVASDAIDAGVHVLVEKPLVARPPHGEELIERARESNLVLQVGHVERFNPAVQTVLDVVEDMNVIAVDAHRLGPPVDRTIADSVVLDLMIHDLDVALALADARADDFAATGTKGGDYATATVRFEDGVVGQFTASRVTQQKVRTLSVTAEECRVVVDYADQSVRVHRQSVPEYVQQNGDVRFRHESLVERPAVDSGEPLEREIEAFLQAVREDEEPAVTGEDGLRALRLARDLDALACGDDDAVASLGHH
jgi:predicted dehydrogenase